MHEGKRGVIDLVSNTARKWLTAHHKHSANTTVMRVPHAGAWLCSGALGYGASAAIASRSWRRSRRGTALLALSSSRLGRIACTFNLHTQQGTSSANA
jgi:hypothetical protein